MEAVGYLSTLLLVISGAQLAWGVGMAGNADGIALGGILTVLGGMFLALTYELGTAQSTPQLLSFSLTLACWVVILSYKLDPRRQEV